MAGKVSEFKKNPHKNTYKKFQNLKKKNGENNNAAFEKITERFHNKMAVKITGNNLVLKWRKHFRIQKWREKFSGLK